MSLRLTCTWITAFLLASVTAVVACPLCYEAARQMVTAGQQLDMADRVVLAEPIGNANRFRIIEVIKGGDALGELITDPVAGLDAAAPARCDPCLLVHDQLAAVERPGDHAGRIRGLAASIGSHP